MNVSANNTLHKRIMFLVFGITICSSILLITGCTSSELVDVWTDSSLQSHPFNTMLVISVSKNAAQRRIWEDAFCSELNKQEVTATPSYRLFPDVVPDTNQVNKIVNEKGFDGILISRRLPTETKTQYQPGYVTQQQTMRYNRRKDRFIVYYRDVAHSGYVDSEKIYVRAIDVWTTMDDGDLIWSATSKTAEQNSVQPAQSEVAKLVAASLSDKGIIASGR